MGVVEEELFGVSKTFRKGQIGSWREEFSAEHARAARKARACWWSSATRPTLSGRLVRFPLDVSLQRSEDYRMRIVANSIPKAVRIFWRAC